MARRSRRSRPAEELERRLRWRRIGRITVGQLRRPGVVVLLGFATLILTAPALVNLVLEVTMSAAYSGTPLLLLPGLMVAAALVLLALFGYGRGVDRVRRDIQAEALRPQP